MEREKSELIIEGPMPLITLTVTYDKKSVVIN
jgi:hypothetical protein